MSQQWLSPEQIAKELGLKSAETVRSWIRKKELPATRLGGRVYRVKREDLDKFLEQGRTDKKPDWTHLILGNFWRYFDNFSTVYTAV